jgi:hypothetical protein
MPAPVKVPTQTIVNALLKWRGNVVAAAGEVGMAPNSLYERARRLGLNLAGFRSGGGGNHVTGNNTVTGFTGMTGNAGRQAGTQKSAPQAAAIYPGAATARTLGPVQPTTQTIEPDAAPIRSAPKRHQPIRIKPEQRDLLQQAEWELQAKFRVSTDVNLILEQFIDEKFAPWLAEKLGATSAPERRGTRRRAGSQGQDGGEGGQR